MKKIKWFLKNATGKVLGFILHMLIPRSNKYVTFNACIDNGKQEKFLHNTKYLYLYLSNNEDFHVTWLCEDKNIIKTLNHYGYKNVYSRKSFKGLFYALRSKYWFYDYCTNDLPKYMIYSATLINLWHGTGGLKKCALDDMNLMKYSGWQKKVYNLLSVRDSYFNVDSEHEIPFRVSAFNANESQVVINGSPRLDVLYNNIPNSCIFMEEDFHKIKELKELGKKIFFYVPTFRETKKNISSWLKSKTLDDFLTQNNAILVCKLHPFDTNSLNSNLSNNFYKMNSNSDLYTVLKYMDAMISDYSSVYFDFLLLDKPIIYHVPDLEEYQEQCRGFYEPYETLTAGVKTRTEDEIINAMQDVINGIDNYKDDRKRLRDQTFKYQDGKNCERVINWIKSLG